ncbi:MAG TPA: hypothetical protein VF692_01485 [Pyrinomonadaceae bacterium]|jgi:hypothetical protein
MENIWKQFLGNLIRFSLFWLLGVFTSNGVIDAETQSKLADSGAFWLVPVILAGFALAWQWAKLRFNNKFAGELHKADAQTPKSEVKRQVLKTNKFVSPI